MRKYLPIIVILVLLSACNKPKVIPADKLSKIYAEMFLTDQWTRGDKKLSKRADTTMVYEAIFNEYGYTSEDYNHTVEVLMDDPESYAKIFKDARMMLQTRLDEINYEQKMKARADSIKRVMDKRIKGHALYDVPLYFEKRYDSFDYMDSIDIHRDSTGKFIFRVPERDTMFNGPRMFVMNELLDSLKAKVDSAGIDSLAVKADSLVVKADSVKAKVDSVAKSDSLPKSKMDVHNDIELKKSTPIESSKKMKPNAAQQKKIKEMEVK